MSPNETLTKYSTPSPPTGEGWGGGEFAVSFKILIICKEIYYVCINYSELCIGKSPQDSI